MTDNWTKQYPSVWVNRRYVGDRFTAEMYRGEGNKLLYQLKNLMTFRNLGQLKMERRFKDGTVITAWSTFGQDFIKIDVSRRKGLLNPFCTIKLLDVPTIIPPMMWYAKGTETFTKEGNVWIIKKPNGETEVEGVDYIKTYYTSVTFDCVECSPLDFTIGKDIGAIEANSPYRPFRYKSENNDGSLIYTYDGGMVPHYMGPPEDSMEHIIYSFWGSGQAEIIKADSDEGGTYILWRAYTEWSNVGPQVVDFSRTGLGYMLMQGSIKNEGIVLCESDPFIIKVDCCNKQNREQVRLWWESTTVSCGGLPFTFYQNMKICKVTDGPSISSNMLWWYGYLSGFFSVIPDISGACLPIKWSLTGLGELTESDLGFFASYKQPDVALLTCNESVDIRATDNCGNSEAIHFSSCCETAEGPEIGYTLLLMSCGGQQTLNAGGGGCSPYSWSASSGTLSSDTGLEVIYTAPPTNPNCLDQPTVTVTDCCGNSASVSFYVNCSDNDDALCKSVLLVYGCSCDYEDFCRCWVVANRTHYRCDGSINYYAEYHDHPAYVWVCYCNGTLPCTTGTHQCTDASAYEHLFAYNSIGGTGGLYKCYHELPTYEPWNTIHDLRSDEDKLNGCCPLNPLTGLPFTGDEYAF